jgi:voltage-gated potassium channel Kch
MLGNEEQSDRPTGTLFWNDILNLSNNIDSKYRVNFLDYLYFSSVTITTLGYGDILPNSTKVRFLVMVESFLGVIIVGAFISSLFMKDEAKESP